MMNKNMIIKIELLPWKFTRYVPANARTGRIPNPERIPIEFKLRFRFSSRYNAPSTLYEMIPSRIVTAVATIKRG